MSETYIYSTPDGWVQLHPDIGAALCQRRFGLVEEAAGDTDKFHELHKKWHELYPWRRALPLRHAWAAGFFGPNSPEDHALCILDSYAKLSQALHQILHNSARSCRNSIGSKGDRAVDLIFLARNAIDLGAHAEALRKKPFEPLAMARIKQKRAFAHRNEGRDVANAQRKQDADKWRELARQIATGSSLKGSALARWVSKQLERKHNISKAEKTVAAALR